MSRSDARICAFMMTFEHLFNKDAVESHLFELKEFSEEERDFSKKIFKNVSEHFQEIEEKIEKNLKYGWKIKDLSSVDYSILLSSVAQIDFLGEPKGLVINEAVRMAKKYSCEKSPAFINGVLSSIFNKTEGENA